MSNYGAKNTLKYKVWKRDDWTCQYCGLEMGPLYKLWRDKQIPRFTALLTVDHIKPLSKGGKWDMKNLITACRDCNHRKANHEIEISIPTFSQKIIHRLLDMLVMWGKWAKKRRFRGASHFGEDIR